MSVHRKTKAIIHDGEENVVVYQCINTFGSREQSYFVIPHHEYQIKYANGFVKIPKIYAINRAFAKSLFDLPHIPGSTPYQDEWADKNFRNPLND